MTFITFTASQRNDKSTSVKGLAIKPDRVADKKEVGFVFFLNIRIEVSGLK